MSKYTTEVRYICESYSGVIESQGYLKVDDIIGGAIDQIFDFDFPIFDESYRDVLCAKILKHYYTREIGAETVGLWKLWLNTRLNEIMPYYNQLYLSAQLEFDPLHDTDLKTDYTRDNTNSGDNTGSSLSMYADTPQGAVHHLFNIGGVDNDGDGAPDDDGYGYLTNATKATNSGNYSGKGKEIFTQTVKGKSSGASFAKRLKEYRETFINIDTMVINELKDLFINLW